MYTIKVFEIYAIQFYTSLVQDPIVDMQKNKFLIVLQFVIEISFFSVFEGKNDLGALGVNRGDA